jgi:hypothetical protein
MSLPARRVNSWIGTFAIVAALGAAYTRLPGAGGLTSEVRWLLGHRPPGPIRSSSNPALKLLMIREAGAAGTASRIFATLLYDRDPRVVEGVLWLASDLAVRPRRGFPDVDPWVPDFVRWFNETDARKKESLRDALLTCLLRVVLVASFDAGVQGRGHRAPTTGPTAAVRDLRITDDDLRWMLRATIAGSPATRVDAWAVLLRAESDLTVEIVLRRLYLLEDSRRNPSGGAAPLPSEKDCHRQTAPTWAHITLANADALAALTRDADEQVRWAAGRMLAVCGDERGLPAVDEHVRNNPGRAGPVVGLLDDFLGPDWRKPFESGGAARQPGAGDGG